MRYTKEQINQRFQMLPSKVQDIILSVEVANAIKEIAKKNDLHIDTAGLLNEEITYVMVGAEKSVNFISNLKRYLHLPENKINAIAGDVNQKIFLPVREALKNTANSSAQTTEQDTPEQSDLRKKETNLENQINHTPLTESEQIREKVKVEQEAKPLVPPPANLPVDEKAQSKSIVDETKTATQDKDETKERHIEKQSPYAKDPYREPIDDITN